MFEFIWDFMVAYPGISFLIGFGLMVFIARPCREPYHQGDE